MSIRLFNSAGGYIDLESGGTSAAANVFTLPAETGTLLTSASSLAAASLTGNVAAARIVSALNAEGSAPIYACRAWVNFNGVTPAIIASGNVSSITDNGAGKYTLNLATALPDVNFALSGNASFRDGTDDANSGVVAIRRSNAASITTTAIPIQTTYYGDFGNLDDFLLISVMVIR